MKEQVLEYIKKHHMLEKNDRVIVGVSGGADSVCLLFVLAALREVFSLELTAVHIEHGLRGEDALEDARFVEQLCETWEVPFRLYCVDAAAEAKRRKKSVEETGREIRYECFEAVKESVKGSRIAVAHNKDDDAETILMNLFRGTGLRGMAGIPPVRDAVIRPLLCIGREEIERFLIKEHIGWRTDKTNHEDDYTRNKVRLHVLPYIKKEINKQAVAHISAGGDIFRETSEYIWEEALRAGESIICAEGAGRIMKDEGMKGLHRVLQKQLIMIQLQECAGHSRDITAGHVSQVLELFGMQTGKRVSLPYQITAIREYEGVRILKSMEPDREMSALSADVVINGRVQIPHTEQSLCTRVDKRDSGEIIPENEYTKWFDYDIIKGNLQLRTRQPGDYLVIDANGGRKKLKSYFIDQKIPREERDSLLLLAEGNHILWVIGYRISAYYKITETTKNVLKVQVDGGE